MKSFTTSLSLKSFTPSSHGRRVTTNLQWEEDKLFFSFHVSQCIEDIVGLTNFDTPQSFKKNLYEHTCFEIFLWCENGQYTEWNFAPNGDWTAYDFRSYRQLIASNDKFPPSLLKGTNKGEDYGLEGCIDMKTQPSRVGVSAIISSQSVGTEFWSIDHLETKPDFHCADLYVGLARRGPS